MFENHNKVLFKNVSETSYVYILSGQKFIENAKNGQFWQKNAKCDIFGDFQTLWVCRVSFHTEFFDSLEVTDCFVTQFTKEREEIRA